MTLDQLRAFVAIVEHGSIRAGSRALGIAQSGLTQQIKRLERSLNTVLFVRTASGIMLTADGKTLLARTRIILGECDRTEQEFSHSKEDLTGSIHLGASSEACSRLLPVPLQQLRIAHPCVQVHIASGPSALLLSGIREGQLDFAITLVTSGSDMTDLHSKILLPARPCIICRRNHPLAQVRSVAELTDAEWVNTRPLGRAGTPSNRLGDWFTNNGLAEPRVVVTIESLWDTLALVSASDYLFLGPSFVVEQTGSRLTSIPVREPIPKADICLVQRTAVPLAPASRKIAAMIISLAPR